MSFISRWVWGESAPATPEDVEINHFAIASEFYRTPLFIAAVYECFEEFVSNNEEYSADLLPIPDTINIYEMNAENPRMEAIFAFVHARFEEAPLSRETYNSFMREFISDNLGFEFSTSMEIDETDEN